MSLFVLLYNTNFKNKLELKDLKNKFIGSKSISSIYLFPPPPPLFNQRKGKGERSKRKRESALLVYLPVLILLDYALNPSVLKLGHTAEPDLILHGLNLF